MMFICSTLSLIRHCCRDIADTIAAADFTDDTSPPPRYARRCAMMIPRYVDAHAQSPMSPAVSLFDLLISHSRVRAHAADTPRRAGTPLQGRKRCAAKIRERHADL